jgi:hypothetical protein
VAQRWEADERGDGIADAAQFADDADELVAAMRRPNWVAEEPELHLLPHLERACESLPLELLDAFTADDGSYEVRLRWTGDEPSVGGTRAAIFSLLGGIAEIATYVRQRRTGETLTFEVVTGFVDETPFKPHGHTLRLVVV